MNRSLLLLSVAPLLVPFVVAQTEQPIERPPVTTIQVAPPPAPGQPAPAPQRVYGPVAQALITREAADKVLAGFRSAYATGTAPRLVVYVNRTLVDTSGGLKLTDRTENFEKTNDASKITGTNTYKAKDGTAAATLADQQTVREIERLIGRVFRNAGGQLADQKVAASLLPDDGAHLAGEAGAKDRQALSNVADIAIEVLISSRNITIPEVSGDASYPVPDIQATAIRLKDAAILGQAAASDIIGKGVQAGRVVKTFGVQDITEATAIALMDDMLTGKR
ncbi:MAG TPA: hypothetical protein VGE76_19505 [Opitutaceae bacterium]